MAVDMFVNFKSAIIGGSLDQSQGRELQVWGFGFGADQPGMTQAGQHATGRTRVKDFTFNKSVDTSSPSLFGACVSNQEFKTVILTVRKAGENPLVYMTVTLSKVTIKSYAIEGGNAVADAGDTKLNELEKIVLNFQKISFDYTDQLASGKAGATTSAAWDISY
ncbi:MAG: Hcp family type VI secretion system effector [Caulobacteraceae bacterium]